jgi:hypothetical protein
MAEPEVEAAWRAEFKRIGETESRPHRGGLNASALRRQRSCSARCRDAEHRTAEARQEKIMTDRRFPPPRSVEEPDPKSSLF